MGYYVTFACLVCAVCALEPKNTNETDVNIQTTWLEEAPGIVLEIDKVNSVTVTSVELGTTVEPDCVCQSAQGCLGNRTVTDPTCGCREVCPGQSGDACSASGPCDAGFGLRCEFGICRGKLSIRADITDRSLTLRWRSSSTEIPQASVWYTSVYNDTDTQWKEVEIKNGEAKVENLKADTNYFVKIEEDGQFEIAVFRTKGNPKEKSRKVVVTNRTSSSLTLMWDDFKSANHQSDYVVEYRETKGRQGWKRHRASGDPFTTLPNLVPNTEYEIRVSAWEKDGNSEDVSDVIKATTSEDKKRICKHKDNSYNVGDVFFDGCDYKCSCKEDGEIDCVPRCSNTTADVTSGCDVITDPNDPCCKTVMCQQEVDTTTTEDRWLTSTTQEEGEEMQDSTTKPSPRMPRIQKYDASTEDSATWSSNLQLKISKDKEQYDNKVQNTGKQFHSIKTNNNYTENKQADLLKKGHQETKMGQEILKKFSGCEFKNQTYKLGEGFYDGCEAKCSCEGTGHISCIPRCPLLASAGDTCQELPDPVDSCCTIMVCKPPGDTEVTENLDNLNLKIETIKAQNATTVEIVLTLIGENTETAEPILQLWYSPHSSGAVLWTKKTLGRDELSIVKKNTYRLVFGGLSPNMEYYFRITKLMEGMEIGDDNDASSAVAMFSNTVSVKTFPAVVEAAFQGCFHNNKTYDVGEIFYDGCQYKCVCHKEGQFECQDRCEVYIDTVGFDNCHWGPSNDDPCCIVPHCDNDTVTSVNESFCLTENGETHHTGDTWETTEGCARKMCKCVILTNGTTRIECKGGCPPIPSGAHLPTPDCPRPMLVSPSDPCVCPYIVCSSIQQLRTPEPPPMCEYRGKLYDVGKEFYDGCRALCQCGGDLRVGCVAIECPHHFPARLSECLEWDIDPDFSPTPPNCCPVDAKCKNDGSCLFKDIRFANYKQIPREMLECGTRCVCMNGNVTCESRCPKVEDFPPPDLPCPPSLAHKDRDEKNCCVKWKCHQIENKEEYCEYQGKRYAPSDRWEVRKDNLHRLCTCKTRSNGRMSVECSGGCPPIPARYREPTPQCARPVLVTPEDPVICPYVVCNNSVSGRELQNVNIVSVNSTTVKVEFTLPSIFVGLTGHVELHFTTDPSRPREMWNVEKFAASNRLFDLAHFEYYFNGLQPETTYVFQVKTAIDALQGGPESDLYKLKMPHALPITTTTTLPPMVTIDAGISLAPVNPRTLKVSWRTFEAQEKGLVDGIQLKYKPVTNKEPWKASVMIHRDVTSYLIHNLEPNTRYVVELMLKAARDIPTKLISLNTAEVTMPVVPKDDYDFQVFLRLDRTEAEFTELYISGVPRPLEKYVHLAKVSFKADMERDMSVVYKVPKTNKIVLKELEPGRRYKVWVDLYLTNGKTLTSNTIEVTTKAILQLNTIDTKAVKAKLSSNTDEETKAYYVALIVVAVIAAGAGFGFILLLVILLRRQAVSKAAITRPPSQSAYDNPTFKPQDADKPDDKNSLHP